MNRSAVALVVLSVGVVAAGCAPIDIFAPTTPTPVTVQTTAPANSAATLTGFTMTEGAVGYLVGTYTKINATTWSGPHPTTNEVVQWSAVVQGDTITLYTGSPPATSIILNPSTLQISATGFGANDVLQVTSLHYQ